MVGDSTKLYAFLYSKTLFLIDHNRSDKLYHDLANLKEVPVVEEINQRPGLDPFVYFLNSNHLL